MLEKRSGYSGPVVDAHMHTSLDNNQGAFALALLNEMNQQGVARVLIQPDHSPDWPCEPAWLPWW